MTSYTIFHLADLHIGNGGNSRVREYTDVFSQVLIKMRAWIQVHDHNIRYLTVIAGDVFHDKALYAGNDVGLFNHLINGLIAMMDVVVIPGNHDTNLGDSDALQHYDLIEPLAANWRPGEYRLYYWRKSGWYSLYTDSNTPLSFYHFSVYNDTPARSPLTELQNDPRAANTILLYHGQVNGARAHITITDSQITKGFLGAWKMALLGDIHVQQFLTDRVAYPGSLIQQNVLENYDKSFIVWTGVEGPGVSHALIAVENPCRSVRVDVRGGKTVAEAIGTQLSGVDPMKLGRIALVTDAEGAAAQQQTDELRALTGRVDHVRSTAVVNLNTSTDAIATLDALLIEQKATDVQRVTIIEDYKKTLVDQPVRRWKPLRMEWQGMFSYKGTNVIDFTRMPNLTGVVAPNRAGKTSIFDILVIGLYGKSARCEKHEFINRDSRYASIIIDFSVDGVRYRIHRQEGMRADRLGLTSANTKAILYEYTADNDGRPMQREIAREVKEVNSKVIELIGLMESFIPVSLYCDFSEDITKKAGIAQITQLIQLFGLTGYNTYKKTISQSRRDTQNKLDSHGQKVDPSAAIVTHTAALARIQDALSTATAKMTIVEEEIKTLQIQMAHVGQRRATTAALARKKIELADAIARHDEIIIEKIVESAVTPPAISTQTAENYRRMRDLASQTTIRPSAEIAVELAVENSQRRAATTDSNRPADVLRAELETARRQLDQLNGTVSSPSASADITTIESELATLSLQPTLPQGMLQKMLMKIEQMKQSTMLTFNSSCPCCDSNKRYLINDLADAESEYASARRTDDAAQKHNQVTQSRIVELRAIAAAHARSQAAELQRQRLTTRVEQLLHAIEQHDIMRRITALTVELSTVTMMEAAQKYYADRYDYDQFTYGQERRALQRQIVELRTTVEDLEQQMILIDYCEDNTIRLAELETEKKELIRTIGHLNEQCGSSTASLRAAEAAQEAYNLWTVEHARLQERAALYKVCYEAIKGPRLELAIITGAVNRLKEHCNHTLAFTGFTMEVKVTLTNLSIYISDRAGEMIPIGLGSGYQRFIISVAFRLALAAVIPNSCSAIFIDEGFGCIDHDNLNRVIAILPELSEAFTPMFIVSHRRELQNVLGDPLRISTRGEGDKQYSHIANAPVNDVTEPRRRNRAVPPPAGVRAVAVTVDVLGTLPVADPCEALQQGRTDEFMCGCGSKIKLKSKQGHYKSKIHRVWEEKQRATLSQ
jgi:DNA repair exonuclease SbcCD nuclease subunit